MQKENLSYLIIRRIKDDKKIDCIPVFNFNPEHILRLKIKIYSRLNKKYYIDDSEVTRKFKILLFKLKIKKENMNLENKLLFVDTFAKLDSVMEQYKDKNIRVCYSGGADSDDMMWLLRLRGYNISAVFYNTGIEYKATWEHIDFMREQGFVIEVINAKRPVPTSNKKYGHPFISKKVSEMLMRLQLHKFDFTKDGNGSLNDLLNLYPNCKSALRWWCNDFDGFRNNISYNRWLKEFLIEYGLPFKVSGKCCDGAKKLPIKEYAKHNNIDLMLLGIRKAEGGARASAYKNCFIPAKSYSYAMYLPLFWWKNEDKKEFEKELNIVHSNCYTEYGLDRTGCAGCPFGRDFETELKVINEFEPKLYKGINNIFNGSYEWSRKYREFVESNNKNN